MGMSLSQILGRLVDLENMDAKALHDLEKYFDRINDVCQDVKFINKAELASSTKTLRDAVTQYLDQIELLKKKLETIIYENHNAFLRESERIYELNVNKLSFEEHFEWLNNWSVCEENIQYFTSKVTSNTNWLQPALLFGATKTTIANEFLSAEPLYILERYKEYFDHQFKGVNESLVRRVRRYTLDELDLIPRNCIGLAAVYNQFPFMPWNDIAKMIRLLNDCLAPGGMLLFNYNNCRSVKGFRYFENKWMCYALPQMFIDLGKELGLELVSSYDSNYENFSVLEFKKAGEMKLIKRHPTVGLVKVQETVNDASLHEKRLLEVYKILHPK